MDVDGYYPIDDTVTNATAFETVDGVLMIVHRKTAKNKHIACQLVYFARSIFVAYRFASARSPEEVEGSVECGIQK